MEKEVNVLQVCQQWFWLNGVKTCSKDPSLNCPNGFACGMYVAGETASTLMVSGGWQTCPKCQGQGKVWFPPNMPWSPTFAGDGNPYDCDVCAGKKVISTISGLPPS
jgi:DnaJ-class molecular chaperone